MNALDTNTLIRFLVKDNEKQAKIVKKILSDAEKSGKSFFVTSPVILEVIWVLSSAYDFTREEIIWALENLLILPVLIFQNHERLVDLCQIAKKFNINLSDLYIGLTALDSRCDSTLTFNKKAAKSKLFTLLS